TMAETAARLAEIKVELGWLADASTSPFPLTARAFGLTLELRGAVPSESVRVQAVKIAREQSPLTVADTLQVQPDLAVPQPVHEPAESLALSAAPALSEAVPSYSFAFEIRAQPQGLIEVRGMIPSYEEKVAVSRRLRQLRGCTCVVNNLELTKVLRDGKA